MGYQERTVKIMVCDGCFHDIRDDQESIRLTIKVRDTEVPKSIAGAEQQMAEGTMIHLDLHVKTCEPSQEMMAAAIRNYRRKEGHGG